MKKMVIICDRCGSIIQEEETIRIMDEIDICQKCWPKLKPAFLEWLKTSNAGTKPKTVKPKKKAEAPAKTEKKVDLGKMQALRDGGWTLEKIAEEMKVSKTFVYNNTTPPAKKKTYPNEFNAADPREAAK